MARKHMLRLCRQQNWRWIDTRPAALHDDASCMGRDYSKRRPAAEREPTARVYKALASRQLWGYLQEATDRLVQRLYEADREAAWYAESVFRRAGWKDMDDMVEWYRTARGPADQSGASVGPRIRRGAGRIRLDIRLPGGESAFVYLNK